MRTLGTYTFFLQSDFWKSARPQTSRFHEQRNYYPSSLFIIIKMNIRPWKIHGVLYGNYLRSGFAWLMEGLSIWFYTESTRRNVKINWSSKLTHFYILYVYKTQLYNNNCLYLLGKKKSWLDKFQANSDY